MDFFIAIKWRFTALLIASALLGCALAAEALAPTQPGKQPRTFVSPEAGVQIEIPSSWPEGRYTIQAKAGDDAQVEQPAAKFWIAFAYLPIDAANPKQELFRIVVFGKPVWESISREPGPPVGEVVAQSESRVYVASVAQANPYLPQTEDSKRYEAMQLSQEQLKRAVSITGQTLGIQIYRSVTGTVTYRQRMALTPDTVLIVQIEDVSLQDAPTRIIGEQRYPSPGQAPIPFAVYYDPDAIDPRHTYRLSARIVRGDRLLFINDTVYPIITHGHPKQVQMLLQMVNSAAGEQPRTE